MRRSKSSFTCGTRPAHIVSVCVLDRVLDRVLELVRWVRPRGDNGGRLRGEVEGRMLRPSTMCQLVTIYGPAVGASVSVLTYSLTVAENKWKSAIVWGRNNVSVWVLTITKHSVSPLYHVSLALRLLLHPFEYQMTNQSRPTARLHLVTST